MGTTFEGVLQLYDEVQTEYHVIDDITAEAESVKIACEKTKRLVAGRHWPVKREPVIIYYVNP